MQHKDALLLPDEGLVPSRRAFLEWSGFGISALALNGCSPAPSTRLVPGLEASSDYVAGKAYWVATRCSACSAGCGVLAKCRDGRPVKLEGNPLDTHSGGGLCATGHADLLALYDSKRIAGPTLDGVEVSWGAVDREMQALVGRARKGTARIRLLTGTEHGPSTLAAIERFIGEAPGIEHVSYDPLSCSALLDAQLALFGQRSLPSFRFERARVIVSFAADFLGTWISPVAFARDYAAGRRPDEGAMSRHLQLEAGLSLTGMSADERIALRPSQLAEVLFAVCSRLELKAGGEVLLGGPIPERHALLAQRLCDELWEARGHGLVLAGPNEERVQRYAAYANHLLGNYGETLSLARPSLQRSGDDSALWKLKGELESGAVDLMIVSGVNPAHGLPEAFAQAMSKAGLLVVHTGQQDESAALAQYVLPAAHALESWGDAQPLVGHFGLQQPLIPAFRAARSLRHVLSAWLGDPREDAELVRAHWREHLHGVLAPELGFERFYAQTLHDGVAYAPQVARAEPVFLPAGVPTAAPVPASASGLELELHPKVGLLDGSHAHNPWLQELPNPVTKATWDNYASLAASLAEALEVELGDLVRLQIGEQVLELPALIQRGQHPDVVSVALGYGRLGTDRFSEVGPSWFEGRPTVEPGGRVGVNAAPLMGMGESGLHYERGELSIAKVKGHVDLALTQEHHSLELPAHLAPKGAEVRDAVLSASLAEYTKDPDHALHRPQHAAEADLWPLDHESQHHHWGMVVDLASCNGCSACVISCQAENNIPVVGKDEVLRHREMHWMRIDRYFEETQDGLAAAQQPMFCQQCDNAPCESVCPVLATVHSSEGLNQQIYNRCVGTRYCANTCPYKVRRFNWFDYPREDQLENHALNPDVTVRTRGVMEKCSFCVQRIQEARSEAIRKGTPLADGDIQVACQQSCPPHAIVFGDLLDPQSQVSQLLHRQRAYRVLEELNVKPSVSYLARIKNRNREGGDHG